MARMILLICVALCGCALPREHSVRELATQGEATGIVSTPEGDVAIVRSPPVAPQDLCYIRARRIRLALVPIRCADLVRAPDQ